MLKIFILVATFIGFFALASLANKNADATASLCVQAMMTTEYAFVNARDAGVPLNEIEERVKGFTADRGLPGDVFLALLRAVYSDDTSGVAEQKFLEACSAQSDAQ